MKENRQAKAPRTLPRSAVIRQVFRAGGPGGQHQNKTESAVRLIHIATGIAAESRSERCQHANYDHAMALLIGKLEMRARAARAAGRDADWLDKPDATFGGVQVRSYVLDRDRRVVDHRTGWTGDPEEVLRGRIDEVIRAGLHRQIGQ